MKAHAVYQSVAHPDDVTVVLDFDRLEAAEVFLFREELKAAMEKGGAGTPTICFASRL